MKTKYYYLGNRRNRQGIKLVTFLRDLKRGVKHINSQAYMVENYSGITQFDMKFLDIASRYLWLNGKRAVMTFSPRQWWTLTVYTHNGYTFIFKGVSAGYYGEGTRGAHDVLKMFGFNAAQCEKAFKHETFTVNRY